MGLNNAAHSCASMKSLFISPNKILEEILEEFLLSQIGQFSSHPLQLPFTGAHAVVQVMCVIFIC